MMFLHVHTRNAFLLYWYNSSSSISLETMCQIYVKMYIPSTIFILKIQFSWFYNPNINQTKILLFYFIYEENFHSMPIYKNVSYFCRGFCWQNKCSVPKTAIKPWFLSLRAVIKSHTNEQQRSRSYNTSSFCLICVPSTDRT